MASTTEAGPENEDSDDQDLVGDTCCCACCHTCALLFPMLLVAAFISGLSLGAPGPTLLAIEHATRSREDQAVLLFSGRAVGAFCGALLGRFLADFVSPRTLIGCGLATAAAGNAMVPACVHIWSLMPVFAVQGFGVYLCLSAVWAAVRHRCWKQQSSSGYLSRRALLACLAAGMLLAPLVAAPFAQPGPGGLVPGNATVLDEHRPIHLMGVRVRRAINASINATTALVESNVTMTTIAEEQSSSLLNATVSPLLSLTTQIPKPPVQRQQKLQPPLSKKPGLADGKHLDQSSSVADGSRHGRVLKLHKEQQRLGSINRVSAVSQKSIINNRLNNNTPMVTAALPTVSNNNSNNNESVATNDTLVINDHYKSNSSNNTIKKLSIAAVAMTTPAATTASESDNKESTIDSRTTFESRLSVTTKTSSARKEIASTMATITDNKSINSSLNMNATSESTTNTAKLITALSTLFTRWRRLAPVYGIYGALAFVSFIGAALAGVCALVCWRRPYDLFPSDQNSWSGEFESVEVEGGYSTEMQLDGLSDEFDESLVSALPEQAALRLCLFIAAFCLHSLEVTLGCYLFSYSIRYLHLTVLSGLTLVCLLYGGMLAARLAAFGAGVCLRWSRSYRLQLGAGAALLCCGVACLWPWGSRWLCLAALLTGSGLALLLPALEDACDIWLLVSAELVTPDASAAAAPPGSLSASPPEETEAPGTAAETAVVSADAAAAAPANSANDPSDHNNNADNKPVEAGVALLSLLQQRRQGIEARRCAASFLACGQLTGEMLVPAFTAYLHRVTSSPLVLVHVSILLACLSLLSVGATCYIGWFHLVGSQAEEEQQPGYRSLAQDDTNED
ncbi:hypothetical protein BOX15_Mlig025171g1 [Macrostomum lignano]|uniref:Uncharacterized protein n=1 Tax=Macrostomum lignano TaxID=282301 RepID=A0A267EUB5_9PLAT|nr:hypothetical protein BOX15_Mlig025171g1 [Macrostomum lignano]